MKGILVTAFEGENNSSNQLLSLIELPFVYKLLLPNHKENSVSMLYDALDESVYDTVFLLGQKPMLKNKISVERCAVSFNGRLYTNFNISHLVAYFNQNNIVAKETETIGTSYCNNIYKAALKRYERAVFVHIPTLEKIHDFNLWGRVLSNYLKDLKKIILKGNSI